MKKCPYCAELIQDEAIKCRYCGSDVRVPPGAMHTSEPPLDQVRSPRVGEGAIQFSHSGVRYILGYGSDFFGVWDRQTPGGPVQRFPRTDDGWAEAWNRFSAMEPGAMEVPRRGVPAADLRRPQSVYEDQSGIARWVQVLVGASGAVALIAAALWLNHAALVGGPGGPDAPRARTAGSAALSVEGVANLLIIPAGVLWVVWQHRAHRNLRAFGLSGLRYTPGWAVGWWLVPFANYVMPYLTMRELWRGSDPPTGSSDWATRPVPPLLGVWWASWLGWIALSIAALAASPTDGVATDQARTEALLRLAGNLVLALAAGLAIALVRDVQRRQAEKHARVLEWVRGFGAQE